MSSSSSSPSLSTASRAAVFVRAAPRHSAARYEVAVYRVSEGAAIVRARLSEPSTALAAPSAAAAAAPLATRTQALDLLVRAVWSLAISVGYAAGWSEVDWRRADFQPARLLDLLARTPQEETLPLPGSPRLDGVGGGRRIAPDGSPGLPPQWVRYLDRQDRQDRTTSGRGGSVEPGYAPLFAAQAWLAEQRPLAWRVYQAHALEALSQARVAAALETSISRVRSLLMEARYLLLARLAFETGEATPEEWRTLLARAPQPTPQPTLQADEHQD